MKTKLPRATALLMLAVICVALGEAGCSRRETPVEAGIRTQTLLLGNGEEPRDLDPQASFTMAEANLMMALFEGLTNLDEATGEAVPGVAEHWDMSPDGLVWTFHLRKNARWSNGDPVTAQDFVYSFRRILSPKFAADYANMLWPIRNAKAFYEGRVKDFNEVGVRARDDSTLDIRLGSPCPWLLFLTANYTWGPVHRATIEKFGAMDDKGTKWTRPGNHVGNGPFKLVEWIPNGRIVVEKSPTHWDASNHTLQKVVFFPIENPVAEELAFRSGQLHVTSGLAPDKIPGYQARTPNLLRIDPVVGTTYLTLNVTKPPFNNLKVRQAVARGLEREAITTAVLRGSGAPAHAYVPPGTGGYHSTGSVPDDLPAAARLLAEAGYAGGRGFPSVEIQIGSNATAAGIAQAIQETWRRQLGITVTIARVDQRTDLQNVRTLNYQIRFGGLIADYPDPNNFLSFLVTKDAQNGSGWSNPEYDALVAESQRTLDRDRRIALQQKAEALLLEEAPIVPLYFGLSPFLIHPSVKGWVPSVMWNRRYQTIELRK